MLDPIELRAAVDRVFRFAAGNGSRGCGGGEGGSAAAAAGSAGSASGDATAADAASSASLVSKEDQKEAPLSTDDLAKACRYCATDSDSALVVDAIENLDGCFAGLLEIALEGRSDVPSPSPSVSSTSSTTGSSSPPVDVRRARLSLRTLVNAANRSSRVRESVTPACVNLWRALIRIPELLVETCASLVATAKETHVACALSSDYPLLLGELAVLWEQIDDRSWLTALFSVHLENDYAFLAHSFADFPPDSFTSLLRLTETILDTAETDVILKVHPNNVLFCVDLLERVLFDVEESQCSPQRLAAYAEQMLYAIDIIASASLRTDEYANELLLKTRAVELISDILEVILDAQAVDEAAEREAAPPREKHPDRPDIPMPARMVRVSREPELIALSDYFQKRVTSELRGMMKCAAVRSIGNLCSEGPANRVAAGARGAVLAVLQCARVTTNDRPFIMQWSIAALRHMMMDCAENQDVVLSIDQKPTGILDRDRLFKELGVVVETDPDSGKLRLSRRST